MSLGRIGTVVRIELLQRLRSVAWYVLLGVFALILVVVTGLSLVTFAFSGGIGGSGGSWLYSLIAALALLLALLVAPTLSGSAINGDRDAAALAPVQVTLVTTGELIVGKFLAAWLTGLGFFVVAIPFLVAVTLAGGVAPLTIVTSAAVLVVEIGVVAGIGVAFSGLLSKPLFSVASTYLVVAALTVGTLIAFGLGGAALRSQATTATRSFEYVDSAPTDPPSQAYCSPWQTYATEVPRFDRVWWILAANPFVVLADSSPVVLDRFGNVTDLFGQISIGVRSAQKAPELATVYDGCVSSSPLDESGNPQVRELLATTAPSWFAGLLVQFVLVAGLLVAAGARTRTPARRLPPGTRIA